MREGPILIGVASGKTAYSKAEWSSLLPLNDGTYQCVNGLSNDQITSDMPRYNLRPALEMIKDDCANDPVKRAKTQNIQVPKVVVGPQSKPVLSCAHTPDMRCSAKAVVLH